MRLPPEVRCANATPQVNVGPGSQLPAANQRPPTGSQFSSWQTGPVLGKVFSQALNNTPAARQGRQSSIPLHTNQAAYTDTFSSRFNRLPLLSLPQHHCPPETRGANMVPSSTTRPPGLPAGASTLTHLLRCFSQAALFNFKSLLLVILLLIWYAA